MFAEWVTTGVGWGIKIASMTFTLLVVAGLIIGFCSLLALILKGVDDDGKTEEWDRPDRSRRTEAVVRMDGVRRNGAPRTGTRIPRT